MPTDAGSIAWTRGDTFREDWTFVSYLVQTLTIEGSPTSGTITLSFEDEATGALAFNSTSGQVQTALEGLPNVAPGDVTVTGGPLPGLPLTITINRASAGAITLTHALTGGSNISAYMRGQPYDLTGATLRWTAKRNVVEPDPGDLQHVSGVGTAITITNAAGGRATHTITGAESDGLTAGVVHNWDVQVTAADGTVATPLVGKITFAADVTRTS